MTKNVESLLILVGTVYLFVGLIGSIFPVMILLMALVSPWSTAAPVFTGDSWIYWAYKMVSIGPCFVIAYAFLRRRNWGRYLLVAYNGSWILFLTGIVIAELSTGRRSMTGAAWGVLSALVIILSGLICLMFREDVKALNPKTQ